ncbi:MAG: MGH1-like glycoside hydrolase domain-containing protein [Terracidiphilus sp.]
MLKALPSTLLVALPLAVAYAQTNVPPPALPDAVAGAAAPRSAEYAKLQARLQHGWDTWDTTTIAGEVLLPEGLEVSIGLKNNHAQADDSVLSTILIGQKGSGDVQVKPGPHSYDGSYSSFDVTWFGTTINIQSAHAGDDLVMLVTPVAYSPKTKVAMSALFSVGFLWNKPGHVERKEDRIVATGPLGDIVIYLSGKDTRDVYNDLKTPYFSASITEPVGISTGRPRSVSEIKDILGKQLARFNESHQKNPQIAPLLEAIETAIGWDTIYEPHGQRVVSTVSRVWNLNFGGYVLFDWDTFFAATLAAAGSRDLAYANALEILNEVTPAGFVPNYGRAGNWRSFDRSEPPVGAITVMGLYRQFHDRWLLEDSFDRLLRWNRWWTEHRDMQGYLVWGSDDENEPKNPEGLGGTLQAAKWESGIDNGPVFDGALFNPQTHQMELADTGLMGMYAADANALAEMADILGRTDDAKWLRMSAQKYSAKLATLWDPKAHIFLDKDLHTGKSDPRLAPTSFYPMLSKTATPEQVDEMLNQHLLNPDEFWGERVLPSIAKNDPAFKDQDYWRGRIWGPMNYLVYLGLRNYSTPTAIRARKELAQKSLDLFLIEWKTKGHVHENYSATMDDSDTVRNSDPFYHWGALMGFMEYMELSFPERE